MRGEELELRYDAHEHRECDDGKATPMKTRNCRNLALSAPSTILRRMTATPMPHMKGREIPTGTMQNAFRPLQRMEWRSSSRPTRKREKRRPMLATDSSVGMSQRKRERVEGEMKGLSKERG